MGLGLSPLAIFDLQNLLVFIKPLNKCISLGEQINKSQDYTILCSTFNSSVALRNIHFLEKERDKVIICDDGSTDKDFVSYLIKLESQGFKVVRNGHKKCKKDGLLKEVLNSVNTKWVIFLDSDSIPKDDIGIAIKTLEDNKADLTSVKVFPLNEKGILGNLQNLEYSAAMLSREIYPYLTSGACIIGKTEVLKEIMSHHSMFFQGEDIEIGLLAKILKKKVTHLDFKVYTFVPDNFWSWLKQRISWSCGSFRHSVINSWRYWFNPLHLIYFTGLFWGILFFKWYSGIINPISLGSIIVIYCFLGLISNIKILGQLRKEIKWYTWLLFPLYTGFQVLILPILGISMYFKEALKYKNWGIIRIRKAKSRLCGLIDEDILISSSLVVIYLYTLIVVILLVLI